MGQARDGCWVLGAGVLFCEVVGAEMVDFKVL